MIRIILVRHGRTAWNVGQGQGQRFRGLTDLPLADEGVQQALVTAQRLSRVPVEAVYSSPLQRAVRTAEILAEPHGLPVQILSGLGSMDYGDWAGQPVDEVARRWPDEYRQWRTDPFSIQVPGGERTTELRDRALAAVQEALGRHSDGAAIVLVTHEVVCRTLVCSLAGLSNTGYWHIRQDLCNLSSFDYDPASGRFFVVSLNDTCHLDRALPRLPGDGTGILLIRHGQTAWNEGGGEERFRGHTDLPLDAVGQAQACAVAERLGSEPIAALYSSPLRRARDTLAPLADRLGLPVHTHAGLLDINYGHWQGLTWSQAAQAYPELYGLWRMNPSQVRFPGGEGLDDVQDRLLALLSELTARHPGENVLLMGHQMVNKVAACILLGLHTDRIWQIQQDTGGLSLFHWTRGGWHTLRLNDTCHLSGVR